MNISIQKDIVPLAEIEARRLMELYPEQSDVIIKTLQDFEDLYRDRRFTDIAAFLRFCGEIEQMPVIRDLPSSLVEPVRTCRRRILGNIARKYTDDNQATIDAMDPDGLIREARQDDKESDEEYLNKILKDYVALAAHVGEYEVVQILISADLISENDIPRAIRILRRYLGPSARGRGPGGGGVELLQYDGDILERLSVRQALERMIRKKVYNKIMEQDGDGIEHHERLRESIGPLAEEVMMNLAKEAGVSPERHQALFKERKSYFEQAANLSLPPCFIRTITHRGQDYPLGSWRQRISVIEALRQRHTYVGAEPGKGKTFIPLLLFETLNQQRIANGQPRGKMIYVSPKMVLDELPNRVRPNTVEGPPTHCYYLPGQEPTVGIIEGGMSNEDIEDALNKDIVFWSCSMLHARRDEEPLYEKIINYRDPHTNQPFTQIVFDEAHMLNGRREWNRIAWNLVHRIPGLYQNGNVTFMSGTPAISSLRGLRNAAEILERNSNIGGEKAHSDPNQSTLHPTFMRSMLGRLIILDDPEDWESFVSVVNYDLYPEELDFIRMIASDPNTHHMDKLYACFLAIRCPQLAAQDPNMPSGLYDWLTIQLDEDLNKRNGILIGEFMRAQAVLREPDLNPEDAFSMEEDEEGTENGNQNFYFYERIRSFCEDWSAKHSIPVHFFIIHGRTPNSERQQAFAQALESEQTGTSKTVILGHSSCFNLGKDLSFIHIIESLQWPWASTQAQQLLKRILRAGNKDAWMTAFVSRHTVEEAILYYARDNHGDIKECLYGQDGMSDEQLEILSRPQEGDDNTPDVRILSDLDSPEQREWRIQRWLQGGEMERYKHFWERHKPVYRERMKLAEESGIGDRNRYTAGLIMDLERKNIIQGNKYLHVHSRGLSLQRTLKEISPDKDRTILNLDALEYISEEGSAVLLDKGCKPVDIESLTGSLADVRKLTVQDYINAESMDAVIIDELEYTLSNLPPRGQIQMNQRARAIQGALLALRPNGTIIINFPREACTREEFRRFCKETLPAFGCTVINSWTGEGKSTDNEGDSPFRILTIVAQKNAQRSRKEVLQDLTSRSLQLTHFSRWPENRRETTVLDNEHRYRKLPALIHTSFSLKQHKFDCNTSSEKKSEQITKLRSLEAGIEVIRSCAPGIREFKKMTQKERADLSELGIIYLSQLSVTFGRPAFRLEDCPNHILFPYDKQWDSKDKE